tara:strand:+ start:1891 stop:4863 length:2973 start_codon:yes stop_codon:yes gene_type:complete
MSAPFTDTYILECNRVHSAQYNDDENTSVWTNSVNDGIQIEAGDKIQVHSAFVSDLGAEDATIEFRGKPIQDEVVLEKTIPSYSHPNISYPTYYGKISNVNTPQTYTDVTDNRVLIETEYYKNANGEYYFTLPLEYANPLGEENRNWALGPRHLIDLKTAPFHFTAAEGYGANTLAPEVTKRLGDDYTQSSLINYKNSAADIEEQHYFTQIANDNSRFTIYRLTDCEREKIANASNNVLIRDPALYNYTRVKNIIDFEVDKGFNSPANIATQVTEALSKPTVSEISHYDYPEQIQGLSPTITSPSYQLFECATPDRFNIANASAYFGYTGQPSYNAVTGSPESVIHYAAQYECIGIKRPEFYDAGCNMSNVVNGGIDVSPNMSIAGLAMPQPANNDGYGLTDFTIKPIITNILYNDENLEAIKKFFDSQDYYPELFDLTNSTLVYNDGGFYQEYGGQPITKDTHRLLHLNPRINASMGYTMNACSTFMSSDNEREFGSDNYHDYRNASGGSLTGEDSRSTNPFFIRYFPEFKNDKTNGLNYDIDTGRGLWGGFAFKAKILASLEPTNIAFYAAVPSEYTDEVAGKRYLTLYPASSRKIGYDRHFTAYGNSAICLYNGLQSKYGWSYDRTSVVVGDGPIIDVNSGWYKQIYVGAKNPLLNFDSGKSRFELSQLHTNEVIDTPVNTSLSGLPDDAGDPVYKFNKAMGYRNYSPTMAPYSFPYIYPEVVENGITYTNKHGYILPNKIYDSLSGMFMMKFGIDEKNWKNSFWGISGFDYSDINFTTGNTNGRITSNNTSELLYVTTNADVLTSAQMGFNSNTQGAPSYLPQLNSVTRIIKSASQTASLAAPVYNASTDLFALYPPTQVSANSATIDALNLPTKTLRPYYTIRSDIIADSNYFGGKDEPSVMPVVSVLDKMNQYGDFFYSGGAGQIEFTVTQGKTITEVKTQICDPSGAPAILSPNSCVMYKIIKTNNANLNVIQDIMAQQQKKK